MRSATESRSKGLGAPVRGPLPPRDGTQSGSNDLSPGRGIAPDRIWFPDPKSPSDYDGRIENAGGIDFFILASGASDGHVAFNPQGSAREPQPYCPACR